MESQSYFSNYAHPVDVLHFLKLAQRVEDCAIIIVTGTSGGGVRAVGALMAVTRSGKSAGYVSNGCVDADVILQAQRAIKDNKVCQIRYGENSPFLDIKLPCGGSLDLLIIPNPMAEHIVEAEKNLQHRRSIALIFCADGSLKLDKNFSGKTGWQNETFIGRYFPKTMLRVVGRGTETIALARLGKACDMEVILQSPDGPIIERASAIGVKANLIRLKQNLHSRDDAWTACILMFHDHDWEYDILIDALKNNAFYIGALGSKKNHDIRCNRLRALKVSETNIQRIKAPIGLIPSVRDASTLAISTLADVAQAYQEVIK